MQQIDFLSLPKEFRWILPYIDKVAFSLSKFDCTF